MFLFLLLLREGVLASSLISCLHFLIIPISSYDLVYDTSISSLHITYLLLLFLQISLFLKKRVTQFLEKTYLLTDKPISDMSHFPCPVNTLSTVLRMVAPRDRRALQAGVITVQQFANELSPEALQVNNLSSNTHQRSNLCIPPVIFLPPSPSHWFSMESTRKQIIETLGKICVSKADEEEKRKAVINIVSLDN